MAENTDAASVGFINGYIDLVENPSVYYPGQTINGSILFKLRQPLNFSVLYIQYVGEANVLWTETESETVRGVEHQREIKYQSNEEYFNYTETLAGGNGVTQLPQGHQTIPFKYQIPFIAPSSFEGEQGSVAYFITATIVNTDMTKEELKKEFTVVAPLDLNTGNPSIKEPIDMEFEEVYSCNCFCNSEPVTIHVRLPVTGYCPGQIIPVAVEVKNESSVEITRILFEILSKELYRSRQPPSEYILPEKVLVTVKRGAVMSHSKRNFTCAVTVPEIIPPYLENCTIIDVGYFFRITFKLSGCHDELQDETEICLGLVPVKETLEAEYKHPMAHSLPVGPIPVNNVQNMPAAISSGFIGSNNSLNRNQLNYPNGSPSYPQKNAAYPNNGPGFTGSNPSINRSQQNIAHNASYQDLPPPYPGNVPASNQPTYQIGFKSSEGPTAGGAPYPCAMGSVNLSPYPGYPTNPTKAAMPQVKATNDVPFPQAYAPSAPPPTE